MRESILNAMSPFGRSKAHSRKVTGGGAAAVSEPLYKIFTNEFSSLFLMGGETVVCGNTLTSSYGMPTNTCALLAPCDRPRFDAAFASPPTLFAPFLCNPQSCYPNFFLSFFISFIFSMPIAWLQRRKGWPAWELERPLKVPCSANTRRAHLLET